MVDGDISYADPWLPLFDLQPDPEKADVYLFTGGADISPELYGDTNVGSYPHGDRDDREVPYFHKAVAAGKPMIGICRGAQLICALNGGKLYQHVNGHVGTHSMTTKCGKTFAVSSLHHQMLRPAGEFEMLGWSTPRSDAYVFDTGLGEPVIDARPETGNDPEVVWYPGIKAYCIQGHPEFMKDDAPAVLHFREEVKNLIINKL